MESITLLKKKKVYLQKMHLTKCSTHDKIWKKSQETKDRNKIYQSDKGCLYKDHG